MAIKIVEKQILEKTISAKLFIMFRRHWLLQWLWLQPVLPGLPCSQLMFLEMH
jgi:hypothetical protein